MKKCILILSILISTAVYAQSGKFRTLNYFVLDSFNVYKFDSFDHVNVTISVHPDRITLINNRTQERKDYTVERFEEEENHTVAHLSNGETFHYQPKFKRVYFSSKGFKTYTEYRRL